MIAVPFSSLSPEQNAQAARMFLDHLFGSRPEEYVYEIRAATGEITGRRPAALTRYPRNRKTTWSFASANECRLTPDGARQLIDLVIDDLPRSDPARTASTCAD